MGRSTRIAGILACAALLAACQFTHTEYGPALAEDAVVESLAYMPPNHGGGMGVGMTFGGDIAITSNSVNMPEAFATVFLCKHGKFVVNGHKDMWQRLRQGQKVSVTYREIFHVTKDGDREISRVPVGLDFLDAG